MLLRGYARVVLRRELGAARCASSTPSSIALSDVHTLHELGEAAARVFGEKNSLGERDATGEWRWVSFAQRATLARHCANALRSAGAARGDRVAVISKNRSEWATTAYGSYGAGCAHVPMYEQQKPSEWEYILADSGASVLFVSRRDLLADALAACGPSVRQVLCFDEPTGSHSFADAMQAGAQRESDAAQLPTAHDLAALIYTSGTTGRPKGVELTHHNILWNCVTLKDMTDGEMRQLGHAEEARVRSLSILPWAHIYGQTLELHGMLAGGHEVAVAGDATTFLRDASEAKPEVLFGVPALFNRIYDGFEQAKVAMSPTKRWLADEAMRLGDARARSLMRDGSGTALSQPLSLLDRGKHAVLDKVVLSKVREKLGGNCIMVGSGGAALSTPVRNFMQAVGIPVTCGYGLTETSPVLTKEMPFAADNLLPGSIGPAISDVLLCTLDSEGRDTLGEPGELCASSPGVMRGYWRNPEASAEVLFTDPNGRLWFKTGDQCVLEHNGHVRIVGRIKEQYKLANGKYVAPTPVEECLARSPFISQVFLFGDNKEFNVALICADWVAVAQHFEFPPESVRVAGPFAYEPARAVAALAAHDPVALRALLQRELELHAKGLKSFEMPQKWTLVPEGFTAARGMLTPKMSVKRNSVLAAHRSDIDDLYESDPKFKCADPEVMQA